MCTDLPAASRWQPATPTQRSGSNAQQTLQFQAVPPAHFVLLLWPPVNQLCVTASAELHEFFIQAADAADGEKTGRAAVEPAVQEQQEQNRVCVKDGGGHFP